MSFNGSGTYVVNSAGQPVVTGTAISSTVFNAFTDDVATALSTCITKDGQTTTSVMVPFLFGVNSTLVTDATTPTTGSIKTAGGLGVAKAAWIGGLLNVAGATTLVGAVIVSSTTDATTPTTGSVKTAGGLGVAKALWVGGLLNVAANTGMGMVATTRLSIAPTGAYSVPAAAGSTPASGTCMQTGVGLYIGQDTGTTGNWIQVSDVNDMSIHYPLRLQEAGGNVGIGTAAPAVQFHTTGAVRMANFGAGAATFDASGNISSVSDMRDKIKVGDYEYGLDEILQIVPILHKWNAESGMETEHTYAGFSAQELQTVLPYSVFERAKTGRLSLWERAINCALVNAVKTLKGNLDKLEARIAALEAA